MTESLGKMQAQNRLDQPGVTRRADVNKGSVGGKRRARMPPLVPYEHSGPSPLSYAQERLWFLEQLGLVGSAYNALMSMRLQGELNGTALERSISELIRRHESLRTRFESVGGNPYQVVSAPEAFVLKAVDLTELKEPERKSGLDRLIREEAERRFDVAKGPLMRASVLKLAAREHVLLLTLHHVVTDGWSWGILFRELGALYEAYCSDLASPLPEPKVHYRDYARWQRQWLQGEVLEEHLQYWRERLSGAPPELDLPTDRPRPAVESFRGSELKFEVSAAITRALKDLAIRERVTLFMVVLTAFQIVLSRWSGQHDVVVGTPVAGRRHKEVEGLIGFFVNTLVLRTDVSGDPTFLQLLGRVRDVTLSAYAHQDLPFEALVAELRPDRSLSRQPIFQVMLALQNYPEQRFELAGLTWTWADPECAITHFDLTLHLAETNKGLLGIFEYATDLFDRETIERMAVHFNTLLGEILAYPGRPISRLAMLGNAEKRRLLEWNETAAPCSQSLLIHEQFEEQARRTPDRIAVLHDQQHVTYAELSERASCLARYLRALGVGPDQLVAICVERSVEMVVAVLGTLKAGGAYAPLDPNYPTERLQYMLEDAAPKVVLTQERLRSKLPAEQETVITLDTRWAAISRCTEKASSATELGLNWQSRVYVIYTSGSTGLPKGTAMTHAAMVNLIEWHRRVFSATEGKRVLQFSALSFDVAFQEIFSTLCMGDTLVLLDEWLRRDARALMELLIEQSVERLFLPPLMLQSLAESFKDSGAVPTSLQDVITAGEQLRVSAEISNFFKRLRGCRLHNHYGPTESHVVTALTLAGSPDDWPVLPSIGRPLSNTQIYILDGGWQPAPIGVAGEIYIGGANVAREYCKRPGVTAQRFIADPFSADAGRRLYRTGDLGRWRADGTLEYLGRNDDQVKIRGYRIELGEIEAQLSTHAQVKEVAAIVREDVPGEKRLVAYVTRRDEVGLGVEDLRAHLRALVPEHMVPSAFVILESLPLTPSGKLDRRALPIPEMGAYAVETYEAPQGEIEQAVAEIWQELLGVKRIGRADNFFELGGHSLHGMRLIARVSARFSVRLSGIAMFQHPTIARMARAVESLRATDQRPLDSIPEQSEEGTI
ncbi:non-ribosomal peptide synthetase [Peristeroidobacter soli]|uniref:non-ribosomal peptide synthetase n=1 Tax=Peristeroidobacter soli TaxID=2497877 RepID=UPI00101B5B63|nr:non-ribosomal peptide synthetase [Peristeroidobacter soli]